MMYYNMESSQFSTLKQQAKQLLLKGCFKMAATKYKNLISNPPASLSPRDLSILYLNQAICHQSLGNNDKSLQLLNTAISTDPSYQKPYYRKIQVCRDLRLFDEILSIPPFVRNKEIDQLMLEVKEEYLEYLQKSQVEGIEKELRRGIQLNDEEKVKEMDQVLVKRCKEQSVAKVEGELSEGIFQKYFEIVKEAGKGRIFELFYDAVYGAMRERAGIELSQKWWGDHLEYLLNPQVMTSLHKLIRLCPYFEMTHTDHQILAEFLRSLGTDHLKESLETLLILINSESSQTHLLHSPSLTSLIDFLSDVALGSLNQSNPVEFQLIWSILSLLLSLNKPPTPTSPQNFKENCYYLFNLISQCQQSNTQFLQKQTSEVQALISSILSSNPTPPYLFLLNEILTRLKFKPEGFSSYLKSLLTKLKDQENLRANLLLLLIAIKVDPSLITKKQKEQLLKCKGEHEELLIELISCICLVDKEYLLLVMNSNKALIDLLGSIQKNSAKYKKLRLKGAVINLLYLICVDTSSAKNVEAANKLGVTVEQVIAAKKLQTPKETSALETSIKERRHLLLSIKMQLFQSVIKPFLCPSTTLLQCKLCSILCSLSKTNPKLFYSSQFLQFMLLQSKHTHSKSQVYEFFASITKQCNPQLLLFKYQQSIVNVLLEASEKGEHQLLIFTALLGIINLQSQTQVDIKKVLAQLYQENEYIIHAALNIVNNSLVKGEEVFKTLSDKDIQTILVYYRHYRALVSEPLSGNTNDYSHPHRIYSTILSLLMVISSYTKLDVQQLQGIECLVESCKNMEVKWRAEVIGKGLMYFANKGSFNKGIIQGVQRELEYIRETNQGFYSQLRRLL